MAEHIPYSITSQRKTDELQPNGRFGQVWRVTYVGPNGAESYVDVPDAHYSVENVDAAIQAELNTVMGVHTQGEHPITATG